MTTVPVPAKGMPPNVKVMAPVDDIPVITTDVPTKLGLLDWVTDPESVTMPPDAEPVSGN